MASPITEKSLAPLARSRLRRPADEVARDLLGRFMVRNLPTGDRLILRIVETEAYLGTPDRASHAFNGRKTERTSTLHLQGGHAYVYFIYGMYNCFNVVAGDDTNGEAVLVRAGEAIEGVEIMAVNRGLPSGAKPKPGQIAGGPGKLCQALTIDRSLDAILLDDPAGPLYLARGEPLRKGVEEVATGPRIGIDYAKEARNWPLRYAIRAHSEMSRPILR